MIKCETWKGHMWEYQTIFTVTRTSHRWQGSFLWTNASADPGFPRDDNPKKGSTNLLFGQNVLKTASKLRKLDRKGRTSKIFLCTSATALLCLILLWIDCHVCKGVLSSILLFELPIVVVFVSIFCDYQGSWLASANDGISRQVIRYGICKKVAEYIHKLSFTNKVVTNIYCQKESSSPKGNKKKQWENCAPQFKSDILVRRHFLNARSFFLFQKLLEPWHHPLQY